MAEAKSPRVAVVLGSTGFVGRRIVRHLADHGFRIRAASRHPERRESAFPSEEIEPVRADVQNEASLAAAIEGAYGVVNAVSLYVESAGLTFQDIHVEAAARVARLARQADVKRLVHLSGIGSDPRSSSDYIRARGQGEEAVGQAFPGAVVVRSAVMIAPDDAFLTTIVRLVRLLPVYPMFGSGNTRLQPVYAEDVAEGIARLLETERVGDKPYEFAGPRIYTYRELVRAVAAETGARAVLAPVPFAFWQALAVVAEHLPGAPLARNQVDLMQRDNVAAPGVPGLDDLGIEPRSVEAVIQDMRGR